MSDFLVVAVPSQSLVVHLPIETSSLDDET